MSELQLKIKELQEEGLWISGYDTSLKDSPGPRMSSRMSCSPPVNGVTYVTVFSLSSSFSFYSSYPSSTSSCVLCLFHLDVDWLRRVLEEPPAT